jgi:hypothetical protein
LISLTFNQLAAILQVAATLQPSFAEMEQNTPTTSAHIRTTVSPPRSGTSGAPNGLRRSRFIVS